MCSSELDGPFWTTVHTSRPADSSVRRAVAELCQTTGASTSIAKAIVLHQQLGYSQRRACAETGVAIASLNRALSAIRRGRRAQTVGRPTRLTAEEEQQLLTRIELDAMQNNCTRTHALLAEANRMLKERAGEAEDDLGCSVGSSEPPLTISYIKSLVRRLGDDVLRLAPAQPIESLRAAIQLPTLSSFFALMSSKFAERQYHSTLIANMDETFFQIHKDKSKVLVPSRLRHAFAIDETAPFHLTIVATVFGDCSAMPPTLIFPLKELPAELASEPHMLEAFSLSGQEAGWITRQIFGHIVRKVLVPEFARRRRALGPSFDDAWGLLMLDGHNSREDPVALDELRAAQVDVITFPSHSSHLLQPLDLWVFLALKTALRSSRVRFSHKRPTARLDMLREIERSMAIATMRSNVAKSFSLAGIVPFDPEVVLAPFRTSVDVSSPAPVAPIKKRSYVNISGLVLNKAEIVESLRVRQAEKQRKEDQRQAKKRTRTQQSGHE